MINLCSHAIIRSFLCATVNLQNEDGEKKIKESVTIYLKENEGI